MLNPIRHVSALALALALAIPTAAAETAPAPPAPIPITPPGAMPAAPPAAAEPRGIPPVPAPAGPAAEAPGPAAGGGPAYPTADAVNAAEFVPGVAFDPEKPDALVLKLQILLDRAGFSPGVIDGYAGRNVAKAMQAAEVVLGLPPDGQLDPDVWLALSVSAGRSMPVLAGYTITPEDAAGPFVPDLPSDFDALSRLKRAAYRTPREMLAERFHMDEDLLAALNPGADFGVPGTVIAVADVGAPKTGTEVTALVADKARAQLFGFDAAGNLVVAYPATIGSADMPSPSGVHSVNAIARNAAYYYRPDVNFVQGDNRQKLTIPPGPNNPIGTTWIDLSEPTYGIHGTPEPSRIDKTNSHGCVRLTNWDVEELAGLIRKGVPVRFK